MSFSDFPTYQPSDFIRGFASPLPGLSRLVSLAQKDGMQVFVDWLEGDELLRVNSQTAGYAVHEVELAELVFMRGGESVGALVAIAENGEDWLSDYTLGLETLVNAANVGA